jgi:translation initiation factor 1
MAQSAKMVLFLCSGNYFRSRFAEILFNHIARKFGLAWQAASRDLALEQGVNNVGSVAALVHQGLVQRGIKAADALSRMPQAVTEIDLEKADRVVALNETEHLPLLQTYSTTVRAKIEYWHMEDAPEALAQIEEQVNDLIARLLGGGKQPATPATTVEPERRLTEKPAKAVTVKVGRKTAGRRGKGVTTVFDLPLDEDGLRQLAATLKQRCGTGGTVKDGRIEMQGDLRDRLCTELEKLGYKVKRVGG